MDLINKYLGESETVIITAKGKKSDKLYDELFNRLDKADFLGFQSASEKEYNTPKGYIIKFKQLPNDVAQWIEDTKGIEFK